MKEILQQRIKEEAASQLSVSVYDTERNEKAKLHRQELVKQITSYKCYLFVFNTDKLLMFLSKHRTIFAQQHRSVLIYGKRGYKKHATCFATLLQNELNSDVARFTTHIKSVLQQIRLITGLNMGGKTRDIAINRPMRESLRFSFTVNVYLNLFCLK